MFTLKDGFVEAIVRGKKSELLCADDYAKLRQCESLSDLKLYLASKYYHAELHSVTDAPDPARLVRSCTNKFVNDFQQLASLASEPLATVLNYIVYSFMIDNVILIMTGALAGRSFTELSESCHPLGFFDSIENLLVASDLQEIHRLVLVDSPISGYFAECLGQGSLDETRVEFIRNSVYKVYLEDFISRCSVLQGNSKKFSSLLDLLYFEADRRVISISISSVDTEMSTSDKIRLFPKCGYLFPIGQIELASCTSLEKIKTVLTKYGSYCPYLSRFGTVEPGSFDKVLYDEELFLSEEAFRCESGYAIFVAYVKLFEQELRNIMWISECLVQQQKLRIDEGLVYTGAGVTLR